MSSLVELHDGQVNVTNEGIGTGATFVVRFPLANMKTGHALEDPRGVAATSAALASLEGIRVIVVDDEADVRGAVAGLLERCGATVMPMESGATIDLALASFGPDVLVLDIGMPGEDGYSLIRRVRRLPTADGGNVPAISLTAHARDEDRRHAMDLGFQAHLAKPVNMTQLVATIRRLVRGCADQSQPGVGEPRGIMTASAS